MRTSRSGAKPTISIHALREEGDMAGQDLPPRNPISIHALREEGDLHPDQRKGQVRSISIHALREEGDLTVEIRLTRHN